MLIDSTRPFARSPAAALSRLEGASLLGVFALLTACSSRPGSTTTPDHGVVVFTPSAHGDTGTSTGSGVDALGSKSGATPVMSLAVSPLALVPDFSPDVQDYYVRCASGDNAITLTVTDAMGAVSSRFDLAEDQALIVRGQYWVRCLPHDFPTISVSHPSGGSPTPGFYLVNTGAYGMVLDTRATPVWYARGASVDNVDAPNTNTISLMPAGTGPYGTSPTADFELHTLDTGTTTRVTANGSPTDLHELRVLPNGNYMLFTYVVEPDVNLSGLGTFGDDEFIADCKIQEVDPSGQLVWSWLAGDHVDAVTESLEPATNTIDGQTVIDVFHCNSIEVDASGNLLVSMRHTNSIFYIDRASGKVLWKLGGTPTNKDGATWIRVVDDPEGTFSMQHDARFRPNGDISLFDDHGATSGVARGVEYAIDQEAKTATVAWQFLGTTQSKYEGSCRRNEDGETVIGWGGVAPDERVVTEVDANGQDVLDISFNPVAAPYRAVKVPVTTLDIAQMRVTAAEW